MSNVSSVVSCLIVPTIGVRGEEHDGTVEHPSHSSPSCATKRKNDRLAKEMTRISFGQI